MSECVCVCERERERVCVCVCAYVCSACVCVCVCVCLSVWSTAHCNALSPCVCLCVCVYGFVGCVHRWVCSVCICVYFRLFGVCADWFILCVGTCVHVHACAQNIYKTRVHCSDNSKHVIFFSH